MPDALPFFILSKCKNHAPHIHEEVYTMPKELAKQYAPQGTEDRIYQNWCDKGYFHTQIDRSKKPFTIVMPPPRCARRA